MNILHKHIRKICLKNIIIALIPLILFSMPLFLLPFKDIFFPTKISTPSSLEKMYNDDEIYVEINFDKLHYTGYNLMSRNDVIGHYYYYIESDTVTFILTNVMDEPKPVLSNYTCKGQITEWDKGLRSTLESYSKDINFSFTGLTSVSNTYIINETIRHLNIYIYLFVYLLCIEIIIVVFIIVNLIIFSIPELHPSFTKFRRLAKHIHTSSVLDELNDLRLNVGKTYFTRRFYISLIPTGVIILPIRKILWIYEHSNMHNFLWFHIKMTYNIHFICKRNVKAVASGYSAEELNVILEYISKNHPNILIGYSDENKNSIKKGGK